jgi:outer membrane autotransporter protein
MLNVSSGGGLSDANGYLGFGTGSAGTATITGSASKWANSTALFVGNISTGVLNVQNGGTGSGATIDIGNNAGSNGTVNVTSGGTLSTTLNGLIANLAGSTGAVTVTGTGSNWTNTAGIQVGRAGVGSLIVSNGGTVTDTSVTLGNAAGSTGSATVTDAGSTWTSSGTMTIGANGTGAISILNGGHVSDTTAVLGSVATGSGSVTVDGSGSLWTNTGGVTVGSSGTGSLTVSNDGTAANTTGVIASGTGSTGTATITGSGSRWTNTSNLTVGSNGTGFLNIDNGGVVADGTGTIGNAATSIGTATVTGSGSIWSNTASLNIGNSGTGTLNILSGANVSATSTYLGRSAAGANGTLLISSGGTLADTTGFLAFIAGSTATATVTGSGSNWTNTSTLSIGAIGQGNLSVTNGGSVSSGADINLGSFTGGSGALTVSGAGSNVTSVSALRIAFGAASTGSLTIADHASVQDAYTVIGRNGTGSLLIEDGGTLVSTTTTAGASFGSVSTATGIATVTGSGSSWTSSNDFNVGEVGTGILTISTGGVVNAATGSLGGANTATGTVTVTGAGSQWNNSASLIVGDLGVGTLTLGDAGTVNVASGTGTLTIANQSGSAGTLNIGAAPGSSAVTPGTLSASTLAFGSGTGTLNFNHTSSRYVFAPAITGSGTINAYAGETTLSGDLTGFTGVTNLLGGDLFYTYGAGTSAGSTINTPITGSGTLSIASGGTTFLASDSSGFTGTTIVHDGSILSVNGQLGGALTVADGGTLKGHGTAGDVNALDGAILAPGNSIGTLTVGSLTTAPTTTYQAEINAGGASDLIHATGTATLGGGTVAVSYAPGTYLPGLHYTILTADGGRTGMFDSETDTLGTLFMDAALSYTATDVDLTITQFRDFATVAQGGNQRASAAAAQRLGSGNDVYNHLVVLQDPAVAHAAFSSLAGDFHASTQSALLGQQHLVSDVLLSRLGDIAGSSDAVAPFQLAGPLAPGMVPAAPGHRGVWVQGFGDWSQFGSSANTASVDSHSSGVLLGADGELADRWQGGAAVGYSMTDTSSSANNAHGGSNDYHAAVYAGTRPATGPSLRLGGDVTYHAVDSNRDIDFTGFTDHATADYNAYTGQVFADASYPVALAHRAFGTTTAAPFGTLAYLHQSTDSFTEHGGAAALHVDSGDSDILSATLGARLHHDMAFVGHDIQHAALDGSLGWKHLEGDVTPETTARFASGTDAFAVDGTPLARNALVYNAAASIALDANASLGISYQGQLATNAQDQSLTGNFRYAF